MKFKTNNGMVVYADGSRIEIRNNQNKTAFVVDRNTEFKQSFGKKELKFIADCINFIIEEGRPL